MDTLGIFLSAVLAFLLSFLTLFINFIIQALTLFLDFFKNLVGLAS